jgi:hypothetical protein
MSRTQRTRKTPIPKIPVVEGEGKYEVVSVNIQERTLTIKRYQSPEIALQAMQAMHRNNDDTLYTLQMLRGTHIITYRGVDEPIIISRIVELRMAANVLTDRP